MKLLAINEVKPKTIQDMLCEVDDFVRVMSNNLWSYFGQQVLFNEYRQFEITPHEAYKDDGNTKCPGSRLAGVWLYTFSPKLTYDWWHWYNGYTTFTLSYRVHIEWRNSDMKLGFRSADLQVRKHNSDDKRANCQRISLNTNGVNLHLTPEHYTDMIVSIQALRERLAVEDKITAILGAKTT
jgi:hypothetical protein